MTRPLRNGSGSSNPRGNGPRGLKPAANPGATQKAGGEGPTEPRFAAAFMPRSQEAPGALPEETRRLLRARLQALRLGATCCAALGGVACYALLVSLGLPGLAAGLIGLVFALLGRVALLSLAGEWLVVAARRSAPSGGASPQANQTPDEPPKRAQRT